MKLCKNCGTACEDSSLFCQNCGTALQDTTSTQDTVVETANTENQEPVSGTENPDAVSGTENPDAVSGTENPDAVSGMENSITENPESISVAENPDAFSGTETIDSFTENNTDGQEEFSYGGAQQYTSTSQEQAYTGTVFFSGGDNGNHATVPFRSIPMAVVLSLITCGIYSWYWIAHLNDEANLLAGEENGMSGVLVVVLCICTCGLFGIYWNYTMGLRRDKIEGTENSNSSVLFLILSLVGLTLVNLCLLQDTLNKKAVQ